MILISVDDHIIEPPDMFTNHLSAKYRDEAPQLVHQDDGADVWKFRDTVIPNVALNAVAGRPKEEYGLEPQGLDEIRPGCFNADERVKDMNAGGVLATMNFPSFPGFAARLFATDDSDFSLALVRAYNDWHIDEWCGSNPGFLCVCQVAGLGVVELRSVGPGRDLSEELVVGVEPAALDVRVAPECPPGPAAKRCSSASMSRQTRSARRRFKQRMASLWDLPATIFVS